MRPGRQGRDLDIQRFYAERTVARADVLLIDDSWVSGASAQSAAAALKLAGARRVAIVVLGRHLDPASPRAGQLVAQLRPGPYDPSKCAAHPQLDQRW
jgi:glutamine phosphoribosylpyrophosphate amidotransferase